MLLGIITIERDALMSRDYRGRALYRDTMWEPERLFACPTCAQPAGSMCKSVNNRSKLTPHKSRIDLYHSRPVKVIAKSKARHVFTEEQRHACPRCNAQPGDRCVTPAGRITKLYPHKVRTMIGYDRDACGYM